MVALAPCACGSTPAPSASACPDAVALVAASDYSSSAVGSLSVSAAGALRSGADLGADPALAVSRGRAFFIARQLDTIFELDPRCGTPTKSISTHDPSHDGSSNPQDVAVAPDGSLWVPRYNLPSIAIIDARGPRSIDISSFDDDKNPNASAIVIADVGGAAKAFVALERLDDANGYRSTRPSMMLRLDVASASVDAEVTLAGRNPFSLDVHGGAIFLAEPGNFDTIDEPFAGVERFDVATSTTMLLVREHDVGGSVAEVAVVDACGAAIVADATTANRTALVTFDPSSGAVRTTASSPVLATEGFDLSGLLWARDGAADVLLVGDRRASGGRGYPVHVFERRGACALTERADAVFLSQKPVVLRAVP
jgi:hypothetical protein